MSEEKLLRLLREKIEKSNKYVLYVDYLDLLDLLNIIEKQQKEIEGLKEMKALQDLIDTNIIIADYSHNYISKDKIREKIEELEKAINQNKIMSIQVRQHGFGQKTIEQYAIRATVEILKELIEENDVDHIPRID